MCVVLDGYGVSIILSNCGDGMGVVCWLYFLYCVVMF